MSEPANLQETVFVDSLRHLMGKAAGNEVDKGFYNPVTYNRSEKIALMHSELSEALEALRDGDPKCKKMPAFTCQEEEFADLLIRVFGYCWHQGLRLPEAILAKMQYNAGRPFMHGRQF